MIIQNYGITFKKFLNFFGGKNGHLVKRNDFQNFYFHLERMNLTKKSKIGRLWSLPVIEMKKNLRGSNNVDHHGWPAEKMFQMFQRPEILFS